MQVEFFRWYIVPYGGGRPYLSRHTMTVQEAQERHPGAVPEPTSRIVRTLPDGPGQAQRCGRNGIG